MASSLVYYAIGGGLGHLVRARAFLHSIEFAGRVTVLAASPLARDARVASGWEIAVAPEALARNPTAFCSWLLRELERACADCLCLDTFPAGIFGELDSRLPRALTYWHVARRLRWQNYARLVSHSPLRFERCWRVEPLDPDQHAFLQQHCDALVDLELRDPPPPPCAAPLEAPYWLVVHSGPASEVSDLVAHAVEMRAIERASARIYVATQCAPRFEHAGVHTLDVFPATPYFAGAERLVTAAGFNLMRQTRAYRHKQTIIPMPRRFDDQFERARFARSQCAAALARGITLG